jgi:dihydrolipoamide dehydrogenase
MANPQYDLAVIGTGPGGYECAIRAAQLGFRTAVVEKNKLGGVCLNIGCIPTKALLKSAEMVEEAAHLERYGLELTGKVSPRFDAVIARSRQVAVKMNKGVEHLMKKNKIEVVPGHARLERSDGGVRIDVQPSTDMDGATVGEPRKVEARHIVIATGARARELPSLPIDGKRIVSYREAMLQTERPGSMLIVGAGAIGVEFAYFYSQMGTTVTIVELLDRLVPLEDADISAELERAFGKKGIEVITSTSVEKVAASGRKCVATLKTPGGAQTVEVDQVLSAVGVVGNVEDLGLDAAGVRHEKGAIIVDEFYRTSVKGVHAIGDVAGPPWLAHVASHEGIVCVEKIAGQSPHPINYDNVPACTYCQPQIASVGLTEEAARKAGRDVRVGTFPFTASGKAAAIGHPEGFVKVIYDGKYGEWLGCHIIGHDATELIAEVVAARGLETTAQEIIEAMHPHPTLSEAVMEASRGAFGRAINV